MDKVKEKPIIMYPINANPPHLGHLAIINLLLNSSSKLIIVLYDKMQACSPQQASIILEALLSHYTERKKIEITISGVNFATVNKLPKWMVYAENPYTIATTSRHIYSNLKGKGYPRLTLIRKPFGWRDEFYMTAYMRSILLGQIEDVNWNKKRIEV